MSPTFGCTYYIPEYMLHVYMFDPVHPMSFFEFRPAVFTACKNIVIKTYEVDADVNSSLNGHAFTVTVLASAPALVNAQGCLLTSNR